MKAEKFQNFESSVDVLVGHIWKTIVLHSRKNHLLRLEVTDEEQDLWCIFCGVPIVGGSDQVMTRCYEKLKEAGIEFEVMISTKHQH